MAHSTPHLEQAEINTFSHKKLDKSILEHCCPVN